ncbi:hypothetical protein PoB_001737900 [Plakobranchus ocellatus]|uniref:Secreted protein n=1 Tax=Plakobranchus ocellatus TaxID=259542 RepID=A0AAV3Z8X8_9GAST|nr:hypothetical protein PoB_001737900 [Plakobranchus ocellatus]
MRDAGLFVCFCVLHLYKRPRQQSRLQRCVKITPRFAIIFHIYIVGLGRIRFKRGDSWKHFPHDEAPAADNCNSKQKRMKIISVTHWRLD